MKRVIYSQLRLCKKLEIIFNVHQMNQHLFEHQTSSKPN